MTTLKRAGLLLLTGAAAFLVFGDSTSQLYQPRVAVASCLGPIVVATGAVLLAIDKQAGIQYNRARLHKLSKMRPTSEVLLDSFATPAPSTDLQVCHRCGSLSVISGMCTVCDVEIGILEDEAEVGIL